MERVPVDGLKGRCLAVLLWGSRARGEGHPRSDVDLAVVAGPDHTPKDVLRAVLAMPWDDDVDAHVFETLPDHLQAEAIRGHDVLWCDDEPALGEYLRPFWKRWRTQAARNTLSAEEARDVLWRMARR